MQSRWKSPVLWTALFSLIGFILGNWGLYDKIGLTVENYRMLVDLLFVSLTTFGIINSPTNKDRL